ncbi:PREDICTED: uncharacterized protein LOC100633468 [Amphimedon queenslandica]|nr:PREDICTED: uncharacterized protein LOC100633468 [Amphimedon queenslandica]|eukprot:XP_019851637.1 PREDICTED: uncharacterized protein LOC100633468 [Amphimedon queenslandica]
MREGKTPVIIDNTNTTAWEMKPYVIKALELKYVVEFMEPDTSWKFNVDQLERHNTHGVARESLERMLERYQHNVTADTVLASDRVTPSRPNFDRYHGNSYHGPSYRGNSYQGSSYYGNRYGGGVSSPPRTHTGLTSRSPTSPRTHSHTSPQTHTDRTRSHTDTSKTHTSRTHSHTATSQPYTHSHTATSQPYTHSHTATSQPHTNRTHSHTTQTHTRWAEPDSPRLDQERSKDVLDFSPPFSPPSDGRSLTITGADINSSTMTTRDKSTASASLSVQDDDSSILTAAPLISSTTATKPSSKIDDLFKLEMDNLLKLKVSSEGGVQEEEETGWYYDRKPSNYGISDTPSNYGIRDTPTNYGIHSTPTKYGIRDTPTNYEISDMSTFSVSETRPSPLKSFNDTPTSSKNERVGGATSLEVGMALDPSPDVSNTSSNKDSSNTDSSMSETGGMATEGGGISKMGVSVGGASAVGMSGGKASPLTSETKEGDLQFLQSCFPDTLPSVLNALYEKSNNNLSTTVDLVLHIPQPSYDQYTLELLDEEEDEWMEFHPSGDTSTSISEQEGTPVEGEMDDIIFYEPETREEGETMEGVVVETRDGPEEAEYDIMKDLGLTKEEYERALGVQLKIESEREKKKGKGKSREREGGDPNATKAKKGIGTNNTGTGIKPPDIEGAKPGAAEPGPSTASGPEGGGKGGAWDDANLMLRLTSSLANQLQNMFGKVPPHMLKDGIVKEEDLLVLLNESVAKGIYDKWIDTIEAKDIEYRFSQGREAALSISDPTQAFSHSSKRRGKKGSKEKGTPLDLSSSSGPVVQGQWGTVGGTSVDMHRIMDEQYAEQMGQQEVDNFVVRKMKENFQVNNEVNQLYKQYPQLSHQVIHWNYYKSRFNYPAARNALYSIVVQMKPKTPPTGPTYRPGTVSRTATGGSNRQQGATEENEEEDTDLDYSDLRAEAAVHAQLRAEAFQKAAKARGEKQGELAMHYAQVGHKHTEKMNDANRRAAMMTYRIKNKGRDKNNLDLHCLHVHEALQVLEERLMEPHKKGDQLFVITGRGVHSKGPPKVKPAVWNRLKKGETKWKFLDRGGMIEIIFLMDNK